jgi:hypothetical protein
MDAQRSAEFERELSACRSASEAARSSKVAELRAQDPELARYQTVDSFRKDLERYLFGDPVSAG